MIDEKWKTRDGVVVEAQRDGNFLNFDCNGRRWCVLADGPTAGRMSADYTTSLDLVEKLPSTVSFFRHGYYLTRGNGIVEFDGEIPFEYHTDGRHWSFPIKDSVQFLGSFADICPIAKPGWYFNVEDKLVYFSANIFPYNTSDGSFRILSGRYNRLTGKNESDPQKNLRRYACRDISSAIASIDEAQFAQEKATLSYLLYSARA